MDVNFIDVIRLMIQCSSSVQAAFPSPSLSLGGEPNESGEQCQHSTLIDRLSHEPYHHLSRPGMSKNYAPGATCGLLAFIETVLISSKS